jgi:squalene-hopene/tetraprenyl-beta-curcumene cyclase
MKSLMRMLMVAALVCGTASASPQETVRQSEQPPVALAPDLASSAQSLLTRAEAFLKAQQKPDGGWQGEKDPPAMTAIVLRAFVQDPKFSANDEFLHKGYEKLLSYQLENGGIYKDMLANYNTAIAISSLTAANDPSFKDRIDKAVAYLKGLQWMQTAASAAPNGQKFIDQWYGGWGYDGRSNGGRPDLSNVQMSIQALHDAGLKPGDPAYAAAIKFITRQQNLSETNDQPWASNDGGFVYGPGADGSGESKAGVYTTADGQRRLRSYGSMTYAGLKSFIYAGVGKDDPRVKAAFDWCRKNWTLDENPGMRDANPDWAHAGLYYYYMTMAKALRAYGQPIIQTPDGRQHNWRKELIEALAKRQRPDGSWVGEARWMESNPVLVTSYAMLALEDALGE